MKITGAKTDIATIRGKIHVGHFSSSDYPTYEGLYAVKPLKIPQILSTRNKLLTDDITILSIPYQEVSNQSGGTTITIGSDF